MFDVTDKRSVEYDEDVAAGQSWSTGRFLLLAHILPFRGNSDTFR